MTRAILVTLTIAAGCSKSDGPGSDDVSTPASGGLTASVSLEAVGSPTPLVWRVNVDVSEPASLHLVFDAADHHVELPPDPTVAAAHERVAKGFHPDTTYDVTAVLTDADGGVTTVAGGTFTTPALPEAFPGIERHVVDAARQEPGYTLVLLRPGLTSGAVANDYLVALDADAEVAWYLEPADPELLLHAIPEGTLLGVAADPESDGGPIHRLDWDGTKLASWTGDGPKDYGIPCAVSGFHHEAFFDPAAGTIVSLSKTEMDVPGIPKSYTDPDLRPAKIGVELVFEFDPASDDCATVSAVNLGELLDTSRIGYDSLERSNFDGSLDWGHGNAVWVDPTDGGMVVSLRNQDALKVLDGELVWILGTHVNWRAPWSEKLLTPVGDLEWQYRQHAPQLHPTEPGRMLVMDNGGERSSPFEGIPLSDPSTWYSRVVEFQIDEDAQTVSQTWVLDRLGGEDFFSAFVGDADYLPATGNILATFGYLARVGDRTNLERGFSERSVRIVGVDYDDPTDVVLDVEFVDYAAEEGAGWTAYRGQRVPNLYGLP